MAAEGWPFRRGDLVMIEEPAEEGVARTWWRVRRGYKGTHTGTISVEDPEPPHARRRLTRAEIHAAHHPRP